MAHPSIGPSISQPSSDQSAAVSHTDSEQIAQSDLTPEKYRPAYHYTPPQNWMSDPNGMVYSDGKFHLCYQHDRYDSIFKQMSWGHAVSADLLHWEEKPPVVVPDATHGMCFSGCLLEDKHNTAGFGVDALVGFYTSELPKQQQSLVYSTDGGETFHKYSNNPVIANTDAMSKDFRDPKVFWFEDKCCWVMCLAGPERIEFWSSENLRNWRFESAFGEDHGVHGCEWECPDLRYMPVDGDMNTRRWMLIVSVNPGAPNGGSGTMYFIGDFAEHEGCLTFVSEQREARWLDWGVDNYAGVAWSNLESSPHGDVVLAIGWMSNWLYATSAPTTPWRGAMTLIRQLQLKTCTDGVQLTSRPAPFYEQLHGPALVTSPVRLEQSLVLGTGLSQSRLLLTFDFDEACNAGITLANSMGEEVRVGYTPGHGFYVDRTQAGRNFHPDFPGKHCACTSRVFTQFQFEIYIDHCSIEVFINAGEIVLTELLFPSEQFTTLSSYAGGQAEILLIKAHEMLPIEVSADLANTLEVSADG